MKTTILVLLLLSASTIGTAQTEANVYETIGNASNLIFSGTVVSQHSYFRSDSLLVTETVFNDLGLVKSDNPARSENDQELRITYAGGILNGKVLLSPDIPGLAVGKRYFVFAKDDGTFHSNPFPGGCKAVIEILRDTLNGGETLSPVSSCRPMALAH